VHLLVERILIQLPLSEILQNFYAVRMSQRTALAYDVHTFAHSRETCSVSLYRLWNIFGR